MNSCQSSRFSQSPTIVQSPASSASYMISSPVTPVLQMNMDRVPFSESFPEIIQDCQECDRSFLASGPIGTRVRESGTIVHSDSFHIERITNIKEIDPQWEHDEIEEIMVISPKPRNRASFLDLGASNRLSIPDFEALRVVGKESSIQTIVARRGSDSGIYAIKTMQKRAVSAPKFLKHVRSEQACLRIVTEGDSPFLPKLHMSFQDETRLYMVLDTFPGGSISKCLDREGPFPSNKARFYACEIVEALSYLHSLNIVHRDVKLENVMIAADGHVVLTNFSCAKKLVQYCGTASNCGTKEYEAPERILGWIYDFTVDVWSFGILLCILHFGQHPFLEGDELDPLLIMQKRILRGQAPNYPSQCIPLSEWGLIKKCLERNPHMRINMSQVKAHEYFTDIDWVKVREKGYEAPYVPSKYGDEVDPFGVDEDNFHFYDRSDLIEIDDSPATDASEFEEYTFSWDPMSIVSSMHVSSRDESTLESVKDGSKSLSAPLTRNHVRSILKSPSLYFPGDSRKTVSGKPEDFLDLRRSTSRLSLYETPERPNKLQKKRRSSTAARSSALSTRKSISSIISEARNGKDREIKYTSNNKYLTGCESSASGGVLNLPKGLYQSGRGIGFTFAPPACHSRLSVSSVGSSTCFTSLSMLLKRLKGPQTPGNMSKSKNEVMQQIYGSTWSIQTNETRMSTVTFGIPDGLGRRVDSVDNSGERIVSS